MSDDDPSALRLIALPEFEPSPDLWSRIEQRHVRRRRQRRILTAGGIAAVLVVAVAVFSLSVPRRESDPLAQKRQETMQLEQDWQALGKVVADSGYARLQPIDVALQRAYDRRAEGNELDRLWSERNQVLRDLIQTRRDARAAAPQTETLISI